MFFSIAIGLYKSLCFFIRMEHIFELIDKTGRKIRLTKRQWRETNLKHPNMEAYLEEIKETLAKPDAITDYSIDENVRYYYRYFKHIKSKSP